MNTRIVVSSVLVLNVLLGVLVVLTPTSPFLTVQAKGEQEVKVWLRTASRELTMTTGEKAQFAVEFGEMRVKMCPSVQDHAFSLLCSHLPSLQFLSPVYLLLSSLILACVLSSFLHLTPLLSQRKPALPSLSFTHYLSGPLSFSLVFTILHFLQNGDWAAGQVSKQEQSAFYGLVLTAIVGVLTSTAYFYLSSSGAMNDFETSDGLLVSFHSSDNSNISLLKSQLESYKNQLEEAEALNQRYQLLKGKYSDLQSEYEDRLILELEIRVGELTKQLEIFETTMPADVQSLFQAKNREISELSKDLAELRSKTVDPLTTEDSFLPQNRRTVQAATRSHAEPLEIASSIEEDHRSIIEKQKASVDARTHNVTGLTESIKKSLPGMDEADQEAIKWKTEAIMLQRRIEELFEEITAKDTGILRLKSNLEEKDEELAHFKQLFEGNVRQLRENAINFEETLRNKQVEIDFLHGKVSLHSESILALQSRASELTYEWEKGKIILESEKSLNFDLSARVKSLSDSNFALQKSIAKTESQLKTMMETNQILAESLKKSEDEVELLRKEYEILAGKHEKALEEITSSSGEHADRMQRVYQEMHEKEILELKEFYEDRLRKTEGEMNKLSEDMRADEEKHSKSAQILSSQLQSSEEKIAHLESQISESQTSFSICESQIALKNDEIVSLKSTISRQCEEITTLNSLLESAQSRLSIAAQSQSEGSLSSQRYSADTGRVTETGEMRAFFEQKILKLRSELITERHERTSETEMREKVVRDFAAAKSEKDRLEALMESQQREMKEINVGLETRVADLLAEKATFLRKIDLMEAEMSQHSAANPLEITKLTSMISTLQSDLQRKSEQVASLKVSILDLESRSATPDRLKQDLLDMKDRLAVKERVLNELTAEIDRKTNENKSLFERIAALESSLETAEKSLSETRTRKNAAERELQTMGQDYERVKERLKVSEAEMEKKREELDKTVGNLSERYQQESDALKRIYEEHFQADLKDIKSLYESRITALTHDLDLLRKENSDLAGSNARLSGVKQRLDRSIGQTNEELLDAQQRIQDLTVKLNTVTGQYHDQINLNMSLETALNSLKTTRGKATEDLITTLLSQNSALTQELSEKSRLLESISVEKSAIKSELDQVAAELETSKSEVLALHKEVYDSKRALFRHSLTVSSVSKEEIESVSTSYPEGEQALKLIFRPEISEHNAIFRAVSGAKDEAPMTNTNVWKTIDTLLAEKARVDRMDSSLGRDLKTLDEITVTLFNGKYKVKSLAVRQLKALLGGLAELEGLNHQYGTLFCRMLGVADHKPFPEFFTNFLVFAQDVLNENGVVDERLSQSSEFGTYSTIVAVQKTIKKVFETSRETGERIASRVRFETNDSITVLMMRVIGCIDEELEENQSWKGIFAVSPSKSVQITEFFEHMRDKQEVWASERELTMLWNALRNPDSDKIGFEEAEVLETPSQLREMMVSKEFLVSKCSFLTAIVDEFEYQIAQDYLRLSSFFTGLETQRTALILKFKEMEPRLPQDKCEEFADETMAESALKGESQVNIAAIVAIRHRIGGNGETNFCSKPYSGRKRKSLLIASSRVSATPSRA